MNPVRLKRGQVWRCMDVACGTEIQVVGDAGPEDGSNPRCTCGSIMKMHNTKPQFRRAEAPQEARLHNGALLRTSQSLEQDQGEDPSRYNSRQAAEPEQQEQK